MRTIYILLLLPFFAGAQTPSITTEGTISDRVFLQKLDVDVSITGAIATSTWTMTFKNTTNRILEGELNFPLPQGISVSGYALDINGRLRDAVPVEKEKATLVFENTERRRIDPGLLEKVDGNTFRTRIYPINPNGVRTVRISYEQELSWERESDLRYRLPLAFQYPIEEFDIRIRVLGTAVRPRFEENTDDALQFGEWKDSWSASRHWKNYQADQPITVRLPQSTGIGNILMQQTGNHYFYVASAFPSQRQLAKPLPRQITLLWDASLSGLYRDRKKELSLLDAYFSRLRNVEVTLVEFSNTVRESRHFSVTNGQWQQLNTALQHTIFDGATQLGILDLKKYPCDEFLLLSDGHSNFGRDRMPAANRPVYVVASAANTDFPYLQSIADQSGGELVDLLKTSITRGCDQLFYQTLHFMGVKPAGGLEENYPSLPTTVTGSLTIAGISYRPTQQIVLRYGYGGKVTNEQTLALDFAHQQTTQLDLAHIWAQKKIAELDIRYEDNKAEIRRLGRSYSIVTRNTSLIVLENINDYITYQIEPPLELREQYDHLMKGRLEDERQQRRQVADNAERYFNELLNWWQEPPGSVGKPPVERPSDENALDSSRLPAPANPQPRPQVERDMQTPLAGAVRGVGVQPSGQLNEVVIRGYATQSKRSLVSKDEEEEPAAANVNTPPGPTFGNGIFTSWKTETNTAYLDKLKAAGASSRYDLYLQLRKDYLNAPLFYFHTAGFFLSVGDKTLGLRILSNIAELEAENYELYKLLGYKLKELGETEAACSVFRKVLEWRPFEPQSYRDYGLALEDAGYYQQALDTLYYALTKNYDANIESLYPGIEETLLPELNDLIARQKDKLDISRIPRNLLTNLPVDMRVVLNWNRNSTDIDLWVTDPDNERCYYGHRTTAMGGRISHDFTRGLGPEQFLLKTAVKGRYKVEVNYYGDTQVRLAGETTLMVEVYTNYGTPQQRRSIITLQMQAGSKGAVYVGDFDFK